MDWVLFLAINGVGTLIMLLLLLAIAGSMVYTRAMSHALFGGVAAYILKFVMVGLNLYFLVPYLQDEEKNWLGIIAWGLAALWWLLTKFTATITQN